MLVVWPSEAAAEDALARDLEPGVARLLDATWSDLRAGANAGDAVDARLALRAACAAEGKAALTRGYLSAVARFVAQARRAGVVADDVRGARGPLPRILGRLPARGEPVRVSAGGEVTFKPRLTWEPADVELILDVARRSPVTVELYWGPDRPAIFEGMERVVRAFEGHPELEALDMRFVDFDEGIAGALWRSTLPPPRGDSPVEIIEAPTPDAELRAVAARVRRLVDAGTAPEDIAIAVRAPRARRVAEELARVGLLLDDRRGAPVLSAPVARLVLDVALLGERRFAREDVLAVVASRYVDFPGVERLRRDARARGATGLALPELAGLPEEATLAEHAGALAALLGRLRVGDRARQLDAPNEDDEDEGDALHAVIARDQAAMDVVDDVLARLARRGERATRSGFVAILADLLAEATLPPRRRRGGAVELCALEDLAGRAFEHVFLPELVETPPAADGIYGDRERRALNQHLGRRAFPDDEERAPFATLLLTHALTCARRSAILSYATTDGERAQVRSRFCDEVQRAAPWLAPVQVPRSPVWPLAQAAAAEDVLARVALELWSDPKGRVPPAPSRGVATADLAVVRKRMGPRLDRVAALAEIERGRWRYFAGEEPAHAWVGAVPGRAAGTAAAPLTARQLEELANCPFTFFAARVLAVEPSAEVDEAAPPQTVGALAHRILEIFYRRQAEQRALPVRGTDEDRRALALACAAAFTAEGPRGHPALWEVLREKLYDDLWRLVTAEVPWGGRPHSFEQSFGPLAIGETWVKGRIDRVDMTPDGPVVIDYKLGGLAAQRGKLRDETKLQLPVYAAAAETLYGGRGDAAYASVRDGKYTPTARTVDPDAAAALPGRLEELAGRVRAGLLEISPVDCRGCHYRTVCRVVTLAERDDG
jgi:RecB family exonuclease